MLHEPAFPLVYSSGKSNEGMLLRDYFASKNLQGMLASGKFSHSTPNSDVVKLAYQWANLMIVERNK